MTGPRIRLVGPASERRERAAEHLTGEGVETEPTADADCVVGVPAGDATGLARRLAAESRPAVLFVAAACDVSGLPESVAVVRDGPGACETLARRVRRLATPVPDGGTQTETGPAGTLERMNDGVVALDADWEITYINSAGAAMLDVDREALVGMSLWEAYPDAEDSTFADVAREAVETQEQRTIEDYYEPLDTWFEVQVYPDEEGLSLFFRDVTERKRVSEELSASEAALRDLHETMSDPSLEAEEKLERILAVGRARLDVDVGMLASIEDDTWHLDLLAGESEGFERGMTLPLSRTYCRKVLDSEKPLSVSDADEGGYGDDPAREHSGVECYLGTSLMVDDERYGTVCFASTEARDRTFTPGEEAFVEVMADWIRYVLERERQRAELDRERAFVESILDSLPDPLYALDGEDRLVRWNDQLTAVTGYEDAELDGRDALDLIAPPDRERVEAELAAIRAGECISVEADIVSKDGTFSPYELSGAPIREDGEVIGATGVARDVSEQQAQREMLSGLLDATGSLMQARDRQEVADIVSNAAQEVLGFDSNVVRLYDADTGTLHPAARSEQLAVEMGERPVYEVGEGVPGEVFATGESRVVGNLDAEADVPGRGTVMSALYQPMGVHGTITVASTERDAFDETDKQVLALLGTSAAAACTRAKRESEVREAREHTETVLNRINGLIENTVEVLVGATTRDELEEGVVTQLAAAAPYTFAWVGQPDVASETLSPSRWAGEGDVPAEDLSFDLTGDGPVARAYQTGTPQITQDIEAQSGEYPSADAVLGAQTQASIVIPLVYKETTYGVLAVFADEAGAFDEREQVVLGALGRAVANAINAVERGRIMDATEIIELEFTIDDSDLLFSRLSRDADCRVEAAGTDIRADGSLRVYLTAEEAEGEWLAALAREDESVTDVVVIADHEGECLLELTLSDSLLATLSEFGAVPRSVVGEKGVVRFTVELPYEAEAREVFELVESRYPSTDLVGYHERERPVETRQEFRAALAERFTDRQETALRTAYLGGFFEWPREIDGNELAEAMGISRPTYHQHLRTAQRKVLEELFD